ncbi:hypothetical protein J6590_025245 [Homalodisca vitripennis]|nr:hypothetical protein J6590_025245 [Homalodisca vitripennis]
MRFNKHVRIIGVLLFSINVGGLKAVAWTDAIQNMFTFFAMVLVIAVGSSNLGGFREVWRINEQGGRIEMFNMDPNPFARNTFWTSSLGYFTNYWITYAVIPSSVQRYLAMPTLRHAKWVLFYACVSSYVVINLTTYLGMIIYARYQQCDPVASGVIKNFSQIVSLYVMEVGKGFPGLAGLFIAGIFSASLSSISSWLNSIAGMLYKDVMAVYFPAVCHSESTQSKIIKTIVIVLGTVCVMLVFVVEKMGTVYQMTVSALGVVYGALFSLFTLGMFFPRANAKGAVMGGVASFLVASWIIFHAQFYIIQGKLKFPGKKTSIDECPVGIYRNYHSNASLLYNYTGLSSPVVADISVPQVYQLSYNYYTTISAVSGLVVGLVVSLLTEPPDVSSLSPDLFTPCVRRFLPQKKQEIRPNTLHYHLTSQHDTDL